MSGTRGTRANSSPAFVTKKQNWPNVAHSNVVLKLFEVSAVCWFESYVLKRQTSYIRSTFLTFLDYLVVLLTNPSDFESIWHDIWSNKTFDFFSDKMRTRVREQGARLGQLWEKVSSKCEMNIKLKYRWLLFSLINMRQLQILFD